MRFYECCDTLDANGKICGNHAGSEIKGLPEYGKPFMRRKRGPRRRDGKGGYYICYDVPRTQQTLTLMFKDPKRTEIVPRGRRMSLLRSCFGAQLYAERPGKTAADLICKQLGQRDKFVVIDPKVGIGMYAFGLAHAMQMYQTAVCHALAVL